MSRIGSTSRWIERSSCSVRTFQQRMKHLRAWHATMATVSGTVSLFVQVDFDGDLFARFVANVTSTVDGHEVAVFQDGGCRGFSCETVERLRAWPARRLTGARARRFVGFRTALKALMRRWLEALRHSSRAPQARTRPAGRAFSATKPRFLTTWCADRFRLGLVHPFPILNSPHAYAEVFRKFPLAHSHLRPNAPYVDFLWNMRLVGLSRFSFRNANAWRALRMILLPAVLILLSPSSICINQSAQNLFQRGSLCGRKIDLLDSSRKR